MPPPCANMQGFLKQCGATLQRQKGCTEQQLKQTQTMPTGKPLHRTVMMVRPENNTTRVLTSLGSLAALLHGRSANAEEPKQLYERATAADSNNTNNISNYGLFLSEVTNVKINSAQK